MTDRPTETETAPSELELAKIIYDSLVNSDPRPDDRSFDELDEFDREMYLMAAQRILARIGRGSRTKAATAS